MKSFSSILLRSTIALAMCGGGFTARAETDLTAVVREYKAEGMEFQQLTFRDNKERIEYELPSGWTFSGSSNQLRIKPPQKSFAEAVVQFVPLSKPQPLDESARSALKEKVIAELPAGSQFAKIEQETESPILLGGQPTFELLVSYQLIGETFHRSILVANRSDNQWSFRFTAKKADFEPLRNEFRRSLLSWQWLAASDKFPQNATAAVTGSAH